MANAWFRVYSEFASDAKVQAMPEVMQRRLIMLLCLRCSNELETLHETELAFSMRISEAELAATKALFLAKKFIDAKWRLTNWEKRQFASDSSTARVRDHRAKHRNAFVTLHETEGNVSVTPQNRTEQNRTDTEDQKHTDRQSKLPKIKPVPEGFEAFWKIYPRRVAKVDALKAFTKLTADEVSLAIATVPLHIRQWDAEGRDVSRIPYPATWLNGRAWEDELTPVRPKRQDPPKQSRQSAIFETLAHDHRHAQTADRLAGTELTPGFLATGSPVLGLWPRPADDSDDPAGVDEGVFRQRDQ